MKPAKWGVSPEGKGGGEARTKGGGASAAKSTTPAAIAPKAQVRPRRRCTKSRNTKARPIISTPDGAMMPGATGIRQGPLGAQKLPRFLIIQFAAGMHSAKPIRKAKP